MKTNKKIVVGIVIVIFLAVLIIYIFHSKKVITQNHASDQIVATTSSQTASSSVSDLYAMSATDRNDFLIWANNNKNYQVVVNATDDGIKNHRDLVWEDVDFWTHRGMALYELGDCNLAGASFYHVLVRASKDSVAYDVASHLMGAISDDKFCIDSTPSSSTQ